MTAIFNDAIQGAFVEDTDYLTAKYQSAKDMIVAVATNSNTDAIEELCLVTDTLIDFIETENDSAMTMLTEYYDGSVVTQGDSRAAIELSLEELKAEILAELEGLLAKLQTKGGWGSRIPLWKRINELIDVYHAAQDAARVEFAGMQDDTHSEWTITAEAADAAYAAVLAQKELDWQAASDVAAAAWAAALAKATEDKAALRVRIEAAYEVLRVQKERDLDVKYNALRASIDHIYDFQLQHLSGATLDVAKADADAECAARYEVVLAGFADIRQCAIDAAAEQSQRHADAQERHENECDAAVEEQDALWMEYSADIKADFHLYQDGEEAGFNGALADWEVAFHAGVNGIKRRMFGYGRYGSAGRNW